MGNEEVENKITRFLNGIQTGSADGFEELHHVGATWNRSIEAAEVRW